MGGDSGSWDLLGTRRWDVDGMVMFSCGASGASGASSAVGGCSQRLSKAALLLSFAFVQSSIDAAR